MESIEKVLGEQAQEMLIETAALRSTHTQKKNKTCELVTCSFHEGSFSQSQGSLAWHFPSALCAL